MLAYNYFRHYSLPEDHFSWDLIKISVLYERHCHLGANCMEPVGYKSAKTFSTSVKCIPTLLLNGTSCLVLHVTDIIK